MLDHPSEVNPSVSGFENAAGVALGIEVVVPSPAFTSGQPVAQYAVLRRKDSRLASQCASDAVNTIFGAGSMGVVSKVRFAAELAGPSERPSQRIVEIVKRRINRNDETARNGVAPSKLGANDIAGWVSVSLRFVGRNGHAVEYQVGTVYSLLFPMSRPGPATNKATKNTPKTTAGEWDADQTMASAIATQINLNTFTAALPRCSPG